MFFTNTTTTATTTATITIIIIIIYILSYEIYVCIYIYMRNIMYIWENHGTSSMREDVQLPRLIAKG